jgi:polyisoprenyl-teichoic acid--peptidoglycan teichoic acid transferase
MSDEYSQDDLERTIKSSPVPEAPQPTQVRPSGGNGSESTAPTVTSSPRVETSIPSPVYIPRQPTTPPPPPPLSRESAARARARRRRLHGRRSADWAWLVIAGALLSVVIIVGLAVGLLLRVSQSEQTVMPTSVVDLAQLPTPVSFRTEPDQLITGQSIILDDGQSLILEPWDGHSRYTVLFMGLDRRAGETGLAYRTDTMMLISLDPATKQVGILSIPRDLYVPVPGYGDLQRINSPMVLGEIRQPGLGPQLAMQTVQYNLGMRVHDYIVVDFQAVIALVDAIGGVTIINETTINDRRYPDLNYGYDPFYLPAGTHHLNGYDALRFARTRHGDSDFARARRQQQVIFALRERILDLDKLPRLILQAPSLLNALNENIYTSLDLNQIIELAWYLRDLPEDNIKTGVIDAGYIANYTTARGEAVLIPNRNSMGHLLAGVFGPNYSE